MSNEQEFKLLINPHGRLHDGDYHYYHQTQIVVAEMGSNDSMLNEVALVVDTTNQDDDGVPPETSVVVLSRKELLRLQAAISYVLT